MKAISPKKVFRITVKKAMRVINSELASGRTIVSGNVLVSNGVHLNPKELDAVILKYQKRGWYVEKKYVSTPGTVGEQLILRFRTEPPPRKLMEIK